MTTSKSHTTGATMQKAMAFVPTHQEAIGVKLDRPETEAESIARLIDRCQQLTAMMYEAENNLNQMTKEHAEAQMLIDDIMSKVKANAHSNSPWGSSRSSGISIGNSGVGLVGRHNG